MTERVSSCERMLRQQPDDGQTIWSLLRRLNSLTA